MKLRSTLLVLAAAAGSAQGAFFSFASDTADTAWTFTGGFQNDPSMFRDATGPNQYLTLQIDDNNGPLPYLSVSVQFDAVVHMNYVGSVPLGGGAFSHNYLAEGTYSFVDVASGVQLLTVNFANALFTARGGAASWFTTAALQVDDTPNGVVNMVWGGAALPGYGLLPGPLLGSPRGFGFDLTALNSSGALPYGGQAPGAALNTQTMLPMDRWWSESSHSATANIPVPGALVLAGVGSLLAVRRRRAS
ncbi:hypothetical protein PHYC_02822 [Phycisphaerales bacterium]|nr:hypothetical protein PHYC_02822 [Phycisphaerales bacterium]